MKIRLIELRKIIRKVIKEEMDRPTIPAHLDPKEKSMSAELPSWGNKRSDTMKQQSPAAVKAKQIANILIKQGLVDDRDSKQQMSQQLQSFLSDMDPSELFVADSGELASRFAKEVLNKGLN